MEKRINEWMDGWVGGEVGRASGKGKGLRAKVGTPAATQLCGALHTKDREGADEGGVRGCPPPPRAPSVSVIR